MAEVIKLTEDGGVLKRILKAGEAGVKAPQGVEVRVHYDGRFPEGSPNAGQIFDSSRKKGREFKFPLGQQRVIKGWDLGVASMERGEVCVLTCMPNYAYGERGAGGVIPPNATLEFEVELLGFAGEPLLKDGSPSKCSIA